MKKPNLQMWAIGRLIPYENNVKRHEPDQVAKIAKSITDFGWDQPIVVDTAGSIIKGHGRRLAAIHLGLKEVPVLVRDDLTPDQVKASRLADNRVALGSFDADMLRDELASINMDLKGIFDSKEIDFMLADLGQMNEGMFIPDVNAAVNAHEQVARDKADEVALRRVSLTKIFGFKDVAGAGELHLTRFIAMVEHETGLTGEAALVEYAKRSVLQVSHE